MSQDLSPSARSVKKEEICKACFGDLKVMFEKYAKKYQIDFDLPFEGLWKFEAVEGEENFTGLYEDETCRVMASFTSENGYEFTYDFTEVMFDDEDLVEEEADDGEYFDKEEELQEKYGAVFDNILAELNKIAGKYYKKYSEF